MSFLKFFSRLFRSEEKCQRFFTYRTRTINITGLTAKLDSEWLRDFNFGAGQIAIKPEYVKAVERLQELDLLQFNICQSIHQLDRDDPDRSQKLKNLIDVQIEMLKIAQSPDRTEKKTGDDPVMTEIAGTMRNIEKVITEKQPAQPLDPAKLRRKYLNETLHSTRYLPQTALDKKTGDTKLHLDAVYTALLTLSVETHEFDYTKIERHLKEEARRRSALDILNSEKWLVLLGEPGSGKSAFVNFVSECLCGEALQDAEININLLTRPLPDDEGQPGENPQPWQHGPLLPLRIILRDLAARGLPDPRTTGQTKHLLDFLKTELERIDPHLPGCISAELEERGGLILLDGLDEVPEANLRRQQIKDIVTRFAHDFPRCRLIVTSRTYAYQNPDWRLPDFATAILAPFSSGQIRCFVNNWYFHTMRSRGKSEQDAKSGTDELLGQIFRNPRLQELAQRPILLTHMASLHAYGGGHLPENRQELYEQTVDLLLHVWEREKFKPDKAGSLIIEQPSLSEFLKVSPEAIRNLLDELAFEAHNRQSPEETGTADVPENDLAGGLMRLSGQNIKQKLLVEYLQKRAGLLLPRGEAVYAFPHRTFQEYLAACYLTRKNYPSQVVKLIRENPTHWREVALLAGARAGGGGKMPFALWALVNCLCPENERHKPGWPALVAGQLLTENIEPDQIEDEYEHSLHRVCKRLVSLIRDSDFPAIERAAAGHNLAILGDPRPEVTTIDKMQFCLIPKGPFTMGDDQSRYDDERPKHTVNLAYDYWLARFPVSVAQFKIFVDGSGYSNYDKKALEDPSNRPVRFVNWHEATAFCEWLTGYGRSQAWLSKDYEIRLPTEAEWEKAARGAQRLPPDSTLEEGGPVGLYYEDGQKHLLKKGGAPPRLPLKKGGQGIVLPLQEFQAKTQSSKSSIVKGSFAPNPGPERRYPWGDQPDPNRANYDHTKIGDTSALGCFPGGMSPYGCDEMSGNVREWCQDNWHDNYNDMNPDGQWDSVGNTQFRVVRGGSFNYFGYLVRCAYRLNFNPDSRLSYRGFRLCVAPI